MKIDGTDCLVSRINVATGSELATEAKLLNIWLVDDNDDYRQLQAQLLNFVPGVKCAHHFSSAEAVLSTLAKEPSPDAILLDVEMPGMSGIQAIKPIKKLAPSTSVLMHTTFYDARKQKQSLAEGAVNFLLKNIPPEEIVAAIRWHRNI
jgi:DNA-binding NarL/FixJ family response regulator